MTDHHARIAAFELGPGRRRWSCQCSCGWIATAGSWAEAVDATLAHQLERIDRAGSPD
jgi:hypothetical protein